MSTPCIYPDLKEMLRDLAADLKESYKQEIRILESNIKSSQLEAVQEAKDMVVEVEKVQSKIESTTYDHTQKITKLFTIVDEIRDSYQQAVGAFKLWGIVCGAASVVSTVVAIYSALK